MQNLNLSGASVVIGFILDCAGPGLALPELYLDSPPSIFLTESLIIIILGSNTGDYYAQSPSYRPDNYQGRSRIS
jgi:hypothetical protein